VFEKKTQDKKKALNSGLFFYPVFFFQTP